MSPTSRTYPNPSPGGWRSYTAWGARFFAEQARDFAPWASPAERRLMRCVASVFGMSDRMLGQMEDADVWRLALAVKQLRTAAADAINVGVDDCYARTVMDLAFLAACQVLKRAIDLSDPDELS